MEMPVLRPFTWFGESRIKEKPPSAIIKHETYRKTPLFDRFLRFDVQSERAGTGH
jgi:hypothetical protein